MEASKVSEPPKEDFKDKANRFKDHVQDYAETYGKLLKVRAVKSASSVGSAAAIGIVLLTLGIFAFVFLSLALAWWLGTLLESHALGFLAVGVFFILLILIAMAMRKNTLVPAIKNIFISKMYE